MRGFSLPWRSLLGGFYERSVKLAVRGHQACCLKSGETVAISFALMIQSSHRHLCSLVLKVLFFDASYSRQIQHAPCAARRWRVFAVPR
jgi:hypothetical protein